MKIKSLKLNNFKLFSKESFVFDKINIIKGINKDDSAQSSNGSGKSSILEAIVYSLYGEGSGKNLADLVAFGAKHLEVKLETDSFSVIRKIPNTLEISQNGVEVQFNTATLKQNWINDRIGSYNFFKKYRLVNKQAINLLDLGIVSLRKELMTFIDSDFSGIRQNLLNKKLERETYNVSKKLYTFYLSEKKWNLLREAELNLDADIKNLKDQQRILLHNQSEFTGKIRSIDYIIKNNKDVAEQMKTKKCPTCGTVLGTEKIAAIKGKSADELTKLNEEKTQYQTQLESLQVELEYVEYNLQQARDKYSKVTSLLMKLGEAKKFADYKYTKADVELYANAVKVLDEFSGWFIQQWLDNLSVIINDLLQQVNLSVTFSADKQFITLTNENQTLKYEQLSSGQQIFLNAVFKLAIMLNNGITDGILIIDEGIGNLDLINLHKLISILQTLNFQTFLVYQNINIIENVNVIEIEREHNQSHVRTN